MESRIYGKIGPDRLTMVRDWDLTTPGRHSRFEFGQGHRRLASTSRANPARDAGVDWLTRFDPTSSPVAETARIDPGCFYLCRLSARPPEKINRCTFMK